MPKTIAHKHEKKHLPGNAGVYDVYLPTASETSSPFLISSGLFGQPRDYFDLARSLARLGAPAIVTNTNIPLPGEVSRDPMAYRPNVLRAIMDAAGQEYHWNDFRLSGHSFGGAYQLPLLEDAPHDIESVDFINSLGFESINEFNDFLHLARSCWEEVAPMLSRKTLDSLRHPSSIPERFHIPRRLREIGAIRNLEEGHNLPFIQIAKQAGIVCRALVSPLDRLVSADGTRRVATSELGESNIVDIHPNADHLAAQNHPRRVAKLLVGHQVSLSVAA